MDIGTLIGLGGGMAAIVIGIILNQANIMDFVDMPSVFITVVGTISALTGAYGLKKMLGIWSVLKNVFFTKEEEIHEVIDMLVSFSEKARREGLLALEDDVSEVQDEFMKKGIMLVVDGTDPEMVKNILNADLNNVDTRHQLGIELMESGATLAPAFGMIGTLIGLIQMLQNLEDKSALGRGMSAALITTMYGSILANWFFTPLATKLTQLNEKEILLKEIMIEGTLSIQSGDNPRIVKEKLKSYVPPNLRDRISDDED